MPSNGSFHSRAHAMSWTASPLSRLGRDIHRDARHGVRTLLKSPGFALVTIAALAVGIGANLTIRHFDSDPRIVGQTIFLSDVAFTVVGIAPEAFEGTAAPVIPRMYATWQALPLPPHESPRGFMIGRLTSGATLQTAQDREDALYARCRSRWSA